MMSMMKTPISRMLLVLAITNDAPVSLVIDDLAALERRKEQGGTNGDCVTELRTIRISELRWKAPRMDWTSMSQGNADCRSQRGLIRRLRR
jgi:hypothetical protein